MTAEALTGPILRSGPEPEQPPAPSPRLQPLAVSASCLHLLSGAAPAPFPPRHREALSPIQPISSSNSFSPRTLLHGWAGTMLPCAPYIGGNGAGVALLQFMPSFTSHVSKRCVLYSRMHVCKENTIMMTKSSNSKKQQQYLERKPLGRYVGCTQVDKLQ